MCLDRTPLQFRYHSQPTTNCFPCSMAKAESYHSTFVFLKTNTLLPLR